MEPHPLTHPTTLKDIARAVGVHLSTVSLALRGSPKIAAATRERVRGTAERLGYRRDSINFALSARRAHNPSLQRPPLIVFLSNRTSPEHFTREVHMPAFLAGAQTQAHAMGFACELLLVGDESRSTAELEALLASRGTQGIILGAFLPNLPQVRLDWSRYAVIKIDSSFMPVAVARIGHDEQQITRTACERLHALGYRRIGMAVGKFDEESSSDLYTTGYRLARHLLDLPDIPPVFFGYTDSFTTRSRQLGRWVNKNKIEVVISNYDSVAAMLEAGGLSVPQAVACAGLCLHHTDPARAGTVMNHDAVGRMAVEMIALLIKTRQFGIQPSPPLLYVEGEWSDGASAPPRSPTVA